MIRDISRPVLLGVVVPALGFFVDLYDIIIFSAERIDSFRDLGIPETERTTAFITLLFARGDWPVSWARASPL